MSKIYEANYILAEDFFDYIVLLHPSTPILMSTQLWSRHVLLNNKLYSYYHVKR